MATNLYEYYTGQGQSLPSVSERAKIFESSGLGSAGTYVGSASQNTALLNALSGGGTPAPIAPTGQPAVQSPIAQPAIQQPQQSTMQGGYDINAIVNAMLQKGYNNRAEAEAVAKGDPERFAREYLGIGGGSAGSVSMPTAPTLDLTNVYDDLYNNSGIKEVQEQLNAQKTAFDQAVSKINDNPYLSEANRVGRVQKLTTDYNNSIATLQDQVTRRTADVETKLGLATKQYDMATEARQNAMTQFNNLLSMGALDNASASTIASVAASTGISTDMINSAIQANKQKGVNTQLIQSEDANGNVTVSVVNSDTGEIIGQSSLGAVGTPSKSSSNSSSPEDDAAGLKASIAANVNTIESEADALNFVRAIVAIDNYQKLIPLMDLWKLYESNWVEGMPEPNGVLFSKMKTIYYGKK